MFPAATLQESVLPGGLRAVTEELPDVDSVALALWVPGGSNHESPEETGFAHLVEHMTFKGTQNRTAQQISLEADAVGGELNAFTEKEYTCYYARFLAEHYQLALDLICDLAFRPLFAASELDREKQVVLQEIYRAQDNPAELVVDIMAARMFDGHPLSRPILGYEHTVRAAERDNLAAFHQRHYLPQRTLFTASGKVGHGDWMAALEQELGTPPGQMLQPELPPPPSFHCGVAATAKDIEQVHVCLGMQGASQTDERRYALALMDTALGAGASSRLFQEVREKRGLAYAVGSFEAALADVGVFCVQAATTMEHVEEVLRLVLKEVRSLKTEGLTSEEIERSKGQVRGALLLSLETPAARMVRMGRSLVYFDRVVSTEEILNGIQQVAKDSTIEAAQSLFAPETTVLGTVGPFPGSYDATSHLSFALEV